MEKVSVIIPTYNRFKFVLNAINSIKSQTYNNIEIIVINDCSTEKEYYEYDWDVNIIHLPQNTKELFGYASPGYVRNKGIEQSTGKYIAFCDDDDIWLPHKLELQINAMNRTGCKMSSTEGFIGNGVYENIQYKKHLSEHYFFYVNFEEIWNKEYIIPMNYMICSSVIIEKEILDKIDNFKNIRPPEDYDCWLRALEHTTSVFIKEPCVYYDGNHGYGRNYEE